MLSINYFVMNNFFDILNAKHIAITCTITPAIAAYMISSKKCHEVKKPDSDMTVIITAITDPFKNGSDKANLLFFSSID